MKTWIRPMIIEECYVSNESIADSVTACYKIACEVGKTDNKYGPMNYHWETPESNGVFHASSGTGNCSDADANRIITGKVEYLMEQKSVNIDLTRDGFLVLSTNIMMHMLMGLLIQVISFIGILLIKLVQDGTTGVEFKALAQIILTTHKTLNTEHPFCVFLYLKKDGFPSLNKLMI